MLPPANGNEDASQRVPKRHESVRRAIVCYRRGALTGSAPSARARNADDSLAKGGPMPQAGKRSEKEEARSPAPGNARICAALWGAAACARG